MTLIDFQTNQLGKITKALFKDKERITFLEFMKIMTLKLDDYGRKKEINAFKVLAGDDDHLMSLSKV